MYRHFLLLLALSFPVCIYCQGINEVDPVKDRLFYIAGVVDSRIDKSIEMLPVCGTYNGTQTDISLPFEQAILQLINDRLPPDSSLIPIYIDVQQFEVINTDSAGNSKRQLALRFNYELGSTVERSDFAFFFSKVNYSDT
ncbi:MAG: hypothetical protein QM764_09730 [Chitinophagaceae bacterium]